ncbi:MAG TPA: hypothetical protein DCY91_09510 [Cyanobacteria bacterium UBA11370]|nr:hypothetical protein [Cyanobacteria bacterium UBA11370]
MEPLGDYIDGKIVPFADMAAQTQKASQTQQAQTTVTSTQSESLIAQAIQQQRTELVAAVVAKTLDLYQVAFIRSTFFPLVPLVPLVLQVFPIYYL